jgi:hypothetical protein
MVDINRFYGFLNYHFIVLFLITLNRSAIFARLLCNLCRGAPQSLRGSTDRC